MSEGTNSSPQVVVGAGPVGLAAALAFRARGLPVVVLEKDPPDRRRPGSRANYIYRYSLERLDELSPGLAMAIAERGVNWTRRRTAFRGRDVFVRDYPPNPPPIKHGSSLAQTVIEDLILERVEATGARVRWDSGVDQVESDEDGVVLRLESGEEVHSQYVVAADGSRSTVRRSLGIEMSGTTSPNTFVVVDAAMPADDDRVLERVFCFEAPEVGGRNVAIVPMAGAWRLDLQLRVDDDVDEWAAPEAVSRWVSAVMGDPRYGEDIGWISTYRFQQVVADVFTDPARRILLCGEAGHLFAPFGGRGMNSGIVDAVTSVDAIARALESPTRAAGSAAVGEAAADRRDAALFNRDCAAVALRNMQATDIRTRMWRRALAEAARFSERAGYALDMAAIGPQGGRPGGSTPF